jgi:hypothetical protein
VSEYAQRFQRLQRLFETAIELEPAARAAWIAALPDDAQGLIPELQRLLQRDAAGDSLDRLHSDPVLSAALGMEIEIEAPMPATVGRFAIQGELGRGGMGRVFHGICHSDGVEQHAAVKVLRPGLADADGYARLQDEARALASLDHPGIARLLEAGTDAQGAPYVAMELVRGRGLLEACSQARSSLRERLQYFRQVLAAVAHAHRALLVHRDIKPGNVMVDKDWRVRLLDFGLAKALAVSDERLTQTAARYLTPAYAAPEQLSGARITIACDIYALGALLYELLSGAPPFDLSGRSAGEAERLILAVPPAPLEQSYRERRGAAGRVGVVDPRGWTRGLRGDIESVVQKALRKEPAARYLSVEAFDDDLRRLLEQRPVAARRGQFGYRALKFVQRNRLASGLAVIAAAGLALAFATVNQHRLQAERERDRAREALGILNDAFVAADPARASGGDTSIRAVLDAASLRIARLAPTQPELVAELAAQIGEVRVALGVISEADATLADALAWMRAQRPDQDLRWRLELVEVRRLLLQQRLPEADMALNILEQARPQEAGVAVARGYHLLLAGTPVAAQSQLEQAINGLQRQSLRGSALWDEAHWHLAEALRLQDRAEAALAVVDRLLQEQTASFGAAHGAPLITRLRQIDMLLDAGQIDIAATEVEQLAPALRKSYGEHSAVLGVLHGSRANVRVAQERYADAANAFAAAGEAYARSIGPLHLNTGRARFNAAQLRVHLNPNDTRADAEFDAAIAAATHSRSAVDPLTMFFRSVYARTLDQRGERAAARRVALPSAGELQLDGWEAVNRAPYLDLLAALFGRADCSAPPSAVAATDALVAQARQIQCSGPPLAGTADPEPSQSMSAPSASSSTTSTR